jgi:hypothetical protein
LTQYGIVLENGGEGSDTNPGTDQHQLFAVNKRSMFTSDVYICKGTVSKSP